MLNCRNGFAITLSALVLSGCQTTTQIEYVIPNVPKDLREPVPLPDRQVETLADVGLVLTDHVEALETANDKIGSIDCILTAAENGKDPAC